MNNISYFYKNFRTPFFILLMSIGSGLIFIFTINFFLRLLFLDFFILSTLICFLFFIFYKISKLDKPINLDTKIIIFINIFIILISFSLLYFKFL
jgi:hypothetical protein